MSIMSVQMGNGGSLQHDLLNAETIIENLLIEKQKLLEEIKFLRMAFDYYEPYRPEEKS